MEDSQDSVIVINDAIFFDEVDEELLETSAEDLSQNEDSFIFVFEEDSQTAVSELTRGNGNFNNSFLSKDDCSFTVLEPEIQLGMDHYYNGNIFIETDDDDAELNSMIPRFHSTPTSSPLLSSTNNLLQQHDTSDIATMLAETDSLIILENESVSPPTKRGRFESGTGLENECCSQNCLSQFASSEQLDCLHFFQSMTISDQNQFLIGSFQLMSNRGSNSIQHIIKGEAVCRKGYMKMFKISEKRYQRNLKLFQSNPTVKFTRKAVSRRDSVKVSEAKAWMTRYFNRIGDSMPHMDQVHLPHGLTKRDVYYMMKGQLLEQGLEIVMSLSHFYTIWEMSFKNVVIPKHSLFSKCNICTKYNKERLFLRKDRLKKLKDKYQRHLKNVEQERNKYQHHREKSRSNPSKYLTVIIDGMDQNKTNIPNLCPTPKAVQTVFRLQTHCTGVLAHTRSHKGKKAYALYDICQWPQDVNLTLHALLHALLDFVENLPEVLYLQLDNAGNQNKNRYLLGFCALLVEKKIFRKVTINFLPVGHTHEDVDQFFSKIASQLRKTGAESIPDLLHATTTSMEPTPTAHLLEAIYDIKSWITPHLNSFHGHSQPHCFKFILNDQGKAVMYFRNWTTSPWCTEEEAAVILKSLPDTNPEFATPSFLKVEPSRLFESIPKFRNWVSPTAWSNWEQFLDKGLDQFRSVPDSNSGWPLLVLQCASQRTPRPCDTTNADDEGRILEEMLDEERVPVQVYTGSYRRPTSTTRDVVTVDNVNTIEVGHLVALNVMNCNLRPLVAKVSKVNESDMEVIWLEGSYTRPWKTAKKKEGRNLVDWTDSVPKSSIILFDFKLTPSNRLRKATVEHLKDVYSKIDE